MEKNIIYENLSNYHSQNILCSLESILFENDNYTYVTKWLGFHCDLYR